MKIARVIQAEKTPLSMEMEFELTPEELEAAYRERQKQYHLLDAMNALSEAWFLEEAWLQDVVPEQIYDTLSHDDSFLNRIVEIYEDAQDCNVPENDAWEEAVKAAVKEYQQVIVCELER